MSDEQFVDNLMALAMGTTPLQVNYRKRIELMKAERRVKELE